MERFTYEDAQGVRTTWAVVDEGGRTRVIAEISGFRQDDATAQNYMEGAAVGYTLFLHNLKGYIEEARDERDTWWRSWAGVNLATVDDGQVRGARVLRVHDGAPAQAAGLQVDDIVTAVNGTPVRSQADLSLVLARMAPGERVSLAIRRGEAERTIFLTLAERPAG